MTENPAPRDAKPNELRQLDTLPLLDRARHGDRHAQNVLLERYRPRVMRWVHGRLPLRSRCGLDTEDIVQNTLLRALSPMERFEPRHEGALLAYLCRIAANLIHDESRRMARRPERVDLDDEHPAGGSSPLDDAERVDDVNRYEEALGRLPEDYQVAIRLRIELGFDYTEIAAAMERTSENAARLLLQRAMKRLAREMHERIR